MQRKTFSKRRQGVVIIYVALALVVLMGAAGLAIDVGNLYLQRDKAQNAADAAALAGAIQNEIGNSGNAAAAADQIALDNGYDPSAGATVTPEINPTNSNWYQVYVSKPAPLFFFAVFGLRNATVGAIADATWTSPLTVAINSPTYYGTVLGAYTVSQFGPWGEYNNGDDYDTKYLENGTPNPQYVPTGATNDPTGLGGYNYGISIPANYATTNGTSKVALQLYDPYTSGADSALDEYRAPGPGDPDSPTHEWDTTLYRLFSPPTTANPTGTLLATATCGENATTGSSNCGPSSSKPETWVTPTGFTFDASSYLTAANGAAADFRLNVETIDGSSENGYELRAGPPLTGSQTFNSSNGAAITATGHIEINFDENGTAVINMGYVPANSTSVEIDTFDTDVGAKSVTYYDSNGTMFPGKLNTGNGAYQAYTINLPANYPGGTWTADYVAGDTDTSVWNMLYTGPSTTAGSVRLVQ